MARTRLTKAAALALGLVVALAGCAANAPQDTLKPEGEEAQTIHNLVVPVFGIAGVVFVLVLGGALFVAIKFRARDDDDYDEFPEQVHGHFRLEIGWTVVPAVILLIVAAFTLNTIFKLNEEPEPDALRIEVYGQQWWWEYRYDIDNDGDFDDIITANDMVIPTGRQVSLSIKARDVIHSWWAPALNGKKDAVPGRTSPLTVTTDTPGEYLGQCTEFCGLSHAEMRIKVVAIDPDSFDTWAEEQQVAWQPPEADDDAAIEGWKLFAGTCTSCHTIRGMTDPTAVEGDTNPAESTTDYPYPDEINQVAGTAPDLTHFMTRSTFAGAMFDLRRDTEECEAMGLDWAKTPEGIDQCLNRTELESWLRNAPEMKAMYPGEVMSPESRGMPSFDLTEEQIDQLVAFLVTLQ